MSSTYIKVYNLIKMCIKDVSTTCPLFSMAAFDGCTKVYNVASI